jgi:hypothetical protein
LALAAPSLLITVLAAPPVRASIARASKGLDMPGFRIHISASSMLGVGYGAAGLLFYDDPQLRTSLLPTCLLATGLCSVSGMLPDLDSGPGIPLRESLSFAAAFVPMLLFDRARHMGWTHESMVLAGAAIYVFIRFGVGWFLRHHSVHRGIYHSIPVCLIFAGLAFLLCNTGSLSLRYYKAGAVVVGFMSHLILDEIWSVERSGVGLHLKSSFGTAVKFYAPCWWSNAIAYAGLLAVSVLVLNDPIWVDASPQADQLHTIASEIVTDVDDGISRAETRAPAAAQQARSIASEVDREVESVTGPASQPQMPSATVSQDGWQDYSAPSRPPAVQIRRPVDNHGRY